MLKDPRNTKSFTHLHLMAKNIERMRDDVTSMAEQAIYFKTGKWPENKHLIPDKTSSDQNLMKLEYFK